MSEQFEMTESKETLYIVDPLLDAITEYCDEETQRKITKHVVDAVTDFIGPRDWLPKMDMRAFKRFRAFEKVLAIPKAK